MPCLICGEFAVEGAHVVARREFEDACQEIYGRNPREGEEDTRNKVDLCPNHHRINMDQLIGHAAYERDRQIVYDFINRRYLLRDDITGQIVEGDWTYRPDVKNEYFAYSNSRASRKLYRKARRVDKRLTDPGAWV